MDISTLKDFPTEFLDQKRGRCHESILRSWQLLQTVKGMLERGDSKETILSVIQYVESSPESSLLSKE